MEIYLVAKTKDLKKRKSFLIEIQNQVFHLLFNEDYDKPEISFNQQLSRIINFDLIDLLWPSGKYWDFDDEEALPISELYDFLLELYQRVPLKYLEAIDFTHLLPYVEPKSKDNDLKYHLKLFILWLYEVQNEGFEYYYFDIE